MQLIHKTKIYVMIMWLLIPGVVGGTFSVILLLLSIFFWTAVDLDSFSSIVFIGDGVISLSLSEAPFNSSLVDVRNV